MGSLKVFSIIFLTLWVLTIALVGLFAFVNMDLDKTKSMWCENGFEELDCGYTLRMMLSVIFGISVAFAIGNKLAEILTSDAILGSGEQNE